MNTEQDTPAEGKTDAIEVRAAEIAKREGRSELNDTDRKKAFAEMQETAPAPDDEKEPGGDA